MPTRRAESQEPVYREDDDLPDGWVEAPLAVVLQKVPNFEPKAEPDRQFVYVDIGSIDNGSFSIAEPKQFLGKDAPSRAQRPIEPGDVLFSNVRTYLRNIALVPREPKADLCSTGFTVMRGNGAVEPRFLFLQVLSDGFLNAVTPEQTGSQYPATSDSAVRNAPFLIAPLPEQRRIVKQVEALLARVNAARARLAHTPALLKAFRRAVLSAACSGKLTEDWREKRTDTRRDAIASGMDATTWPSDWSDMELPHGWRWAHLPEIADCRLGKMLDKAKNSGTPTKYLRNINVRWFEFDLSDLLELKLEPEERAKYLLKNGDVLICEGGEPGRAAVWTGGKTDLVFQKALHRVRFISGVNAAWLVYCLRNDADSNRLETLFTGSTIKHLTGKALDQYPLALPPSIEQDEIVRRVMALFALADAIEAKMAAARKRADALTQAILAKAFRGELVPTEAALARAEGRPYESAGELLLRTPSQEQTKANPGRGNSQRRR